MQTDPIELLRCTMSDWAAQMARLWMIYLRIHEGGWRHGLASPYSVYRAVCLELGCD